MIPDVFVLPFLQRAFVAAILIGLTAPSVGIFLVQRRQALLGDGIGHIALFGVAVGLLLRTQPVITAVVVASLGSLLIEGVRSRGRASGDVALSLLFYGGIAGGVLVIGLSPTGTPATLLSYLFGSLSTVSPTDLVVIAVLAALVLTVTLGGSRLLFAVCQDEESARVSGLPVGLANAALAVTAAVTVTVAMRVVGALLISALMVVPVATAQTLTHGFAATRRFALALGVVWAISGVTISYYGDVAPGATIVVLAIGGFALASIASLVTGRARHEQQEDESDYDDGYDHDEAVEATP